MEKLWLFLLLAFSLSALAASGTTTHFSVSGPANAPNAIPFNFTVTALNASNQRVTSYSGTVHFTSTDPHPLLPVDSKLVNGTRSFSATLTAGGSQTITATDTAMSSIKGTSNSINVSAFADSFPVEMFGAKGDGVTDDTAAIQNAINAAAAAGGGSVVFKVARYFTTGTFVVPDGVVLCGTVEGPFDVKGADPAATAIAPTLLVTNTSAPFVTLNGLGAGVTDLLFHYPNQVNTSASVPTVYPYTVLSNLPGTKIVRSTVTNAYNFLDIDSVQGNGRVIAEDLFIGAFNIGVHIDHTYDFTSLHNLHNGVFWDEVENASYPSVIDNWVLNHGTALVVGRMDALEVHDFFVFSRFTGILLTDSPDTTLNPRCGWGSGSNIDLETVQYGIIAISSTGQAFKFSNLQVGAAPGLGQAAVQLRAGGSCAPDVLINGGSALGTWALGAFPAPQAGNLTVVNMIKALTTTTVSSSSNPSFAGQPVTFTSMVTSDFDTPAGAVTFFADGVALGTAVTLDASGQAQTTTAALTVESHLMTAQYTPADTSHAPSTSPTLIQIVNKNPSSTSLAANPASPGNLVDTSNTPITFTVTVTGNAFGGAPTGTIQFFDLNNPLGATVTLTPATVTTSTAVFSTASNALGAGAHAITAFYSGNAAYVGSTSGSVPYIIKTSGQTVTTQLTLAPNLNPVSFEIYNGQLILTATIQDQSGTTLTVTTPAVDFVEGNVLLGTAAPVGGIARLTIDARSIPYWLFGDHNVFATWGGDATRTAVISPVQVVQHTVRPHGNH